MVGAAEANRPQQPSGSRAALGGLSARARYGFAVGDFGFNLYWQGLGLFLIYFQTDVLGIPAAWAGACYLIASVWDGMTDPVMGVIADRTRSRWGKYRPFLLFGSAPLAIAFALVFSAPRLPLPWLIVYSMLTQMAVRALYTALAIPYSSLSAAITRDSGERTALIGLRMQCAFLGGVAVAYLMPALASWFGGPETRSAYELAALVIGTLATAAFLLCFVSVREPRQGGPDAAVMPSLLPDAKAFLRVVRASGPLLRLLLGKFLINFTLTMHTRNMVYFFKYVLGAVDAVRYAVPLLTAASVISVPFWVWIIRRSSKRNAWILGSLATAAFTLCLQLPVRLPLPVAVALLGAVAASSTAYAVCFWAMLPDTVEYNEWRSGRRDEAKVFGIASFTQKIAMGLSAASAGLYLDASGFTANQPQSPEALGAIRSIMGWIPAAGALMSLLVMRGYRLDDAVHGRIVRALDARQHDLDGFKPEGRPRKPRRRADPAERG
ncbi:MAG TPA: glycoside-pentoside-hexuronide (GPH):cation symporter [Burkholderiaceae bacterium]|nr:glycoside-pentoside-hexuronide (GPH):cation symporter [Burkholderiaceae bacterium]